MPHVSLPHSNVFFLQEWNMEMCFSLCVDDVSLYPITISSTSHYGSLCGCPWFASVFSAGPLWLNCDTGRDQTRDYMYWGTKRENNGVMNLIYFLQIFLLSASAFLVFDFI